MACRVCLSFRFVEHGKRWACITKEAKSRALLRDSCASTNQAPTLLKWQSVPSSDLIQTSWLREALRIVTNCPHLAICDLQTVVITPQHHVAIHRVQIKHGACACFCKLIWQFAHTWPHMRKLNIGMGLRIHHERCCWCGSNQMFNTWSRIVISPEALSTECSFLLRVMQQSNNCYDWPSQQNKLSYLNVWNPKRCLP